MKNGVISIRFTILCGSHTSSVVFWLKTAPFGPELQVSIGPRPHLRLCACKTAWIAPELIVSMGPSPHLWFWEHGTACLAQEYQDYLGSNPHLWFCACKTATLGLELQVSVSPRSYLWFLHSKQRLLDENDKSLRVQGMTCRFVHVQQHD